MCMLLVFFFFQAEDGIRDTSVTGVQTCALPISPAALAAALGVRLVTFDRPGYGGSDRRRGRELLDTPADVTALTDALGVDQFAVLGASAGGAHALACAVALGERVTDVGVASMP